MRTSILALLLAALSSGCGSTQADPSAEAVEIPGPPGVRCYAILDRDGEAIGGSCLAD
jgi:hypothetical protein